MRLTKLIAVMLTLLVAFSTADVFAQTRKKGASGKPATTARKKVGTASTTVKPLTKANIEGNYYTGQWVSNTEMGKDVGIDITIDFNEPNGFTWGVLGNDLGGEWSVTGNKLKVVSGGLVMTLTSPDKGKTLKGSLLSKGKPSGSIVLHNIPNGHLEGDELKNAFNKGLFGCDVYMSNNGEGMSFPAKFTVTPNADGSGGSYKVVADNLIGLGIVKGTYQFTDDGVVFTSNLNGCSTEVQKPLSNKKGLYAQIGTKKLDDGTVMSVTLVFYLK